MFCQHILQSDFRTLVKQCPLLQARSYIKAFNRNINSSNNILWATPDNTEVGKEFLKICEFLNFMILFMEDISGGTETIIHFPLFEASPISC